ncbi:MAG TPA: type II toxin-antitoxin system VapC family toxin [Micromonosporaceae bacterium]
MTLLLDTHVVLWWLNDDPTLPADIKSRLDTEPEVYVSAVTTWEVCIKQAIGKLHSAADLAESIRNAGFDELPINMRHTIIAGRLPRHHRDPFDRLLIAQAQLEGLTLVSRDGEISKYKVALLPV